MRFSERRTSPRVTLTTRVDFALGRRDGERGLECVDLSTTGLGAECQVPPRPGTEVSFGLRLGREKEPCRGRGRVVWVQPMLERRELRYRIAIHFTELAPECSSVLERTVGQQLEDSDTMSIPRSLIASLTRH